MKRIFYGLVVALSIIYLPVKAQFTIDGEFRSRGELRNGYRELASDVTHPAILVSQRSRLVLKYAESDFTFKFSAQDARVWGQNWGGMASNTIHIYEAWAGYKPHKNLLIKVGRQELKYDDQKIMANRNYSITGVTYDAALLIYTCKDNDLSVHWGSMINNSSEIKFLNYYGNAFKYMSFLWSEKIFSEKARFNTLYFIDVTQNPDSPEKMYGRSTIGANGIFNPSKNFGARIGGYFQFGKHWMNFNGAMPNKEISVRAFAYNATLWVKPTDNFKISANIDTYSGQDWSLSSNVFTGFNRLLAAGHNNLGFMDYFTTMDLMEVKWAGLDDFYFRAEANINEKLSLQGTYHYFMLNKPYLTSLNPSGFDKVDPNLGSEIDLVANYKVSKSFAIEATFMTMIPTQTLEKIKLTGTEKKFSFFSYISLLFTPRFIEWQKPKPVGEE
jgi:hypothetical protein